MANPFTRSLTAGLRNAKLAGFVQQWDALEQLVIRVVRAKNASREDEREWTVTREWLVGELPAWSMLFAEHWQGRLIGGEPAQSDPFAALIAYEEARQFVGNQPAMQTLPAAREALNLAIVAVRAWV